jgi:excisionase family DNA binding protein
MVNSNPPHKGVNDVTSEQGPDTDDPALTVREVATRLGVSERTVCRYVRRHLFENVWRTERSYRIPQKSLDHYIRERMQ